MKTLTRVRGAAPSPSSGGGAAGAIIDTTPSAGLTTRPARVGVTRRRIAEEVVAPDREPDPDPARRLPEQEEQPGRHREERDEAVALRMHRLQYGRDERQRQGSRDRLKVGA